MLSHPRHHHQRYLFNVKQEWHLGLVDSKNLFVFITIALRYVP